METDGKPGEKGTRRETETEWNDESEKKGKEIKVLSMDLKEVMINSNRARRKAQAEAEETQGG